MTTSGCNHVTSVSIGSDGSSKEKASFVTLRDITNFRKSTRSIEKIRIDRVVEALRQKNQISRVGIDRGKFAFRAAIISLERPVPNRIAVIGSTQTSKNGPSRVSDNFWRIKTFVLNVGIQVKRETSLAPSSFHISNLSEVVTITTTVSESFAKSRFVPNLTIFSSGSTPTIVLFEN
jgi:hypothetical protein